MPSPIPFRLVLAALALSTTTASAQSRPTPLDPIVVVGSRAQPGDAARVVSVITRDDIARSSARTVAELLSFQMGVDAYTRSAAQADISLRGSTADQTLVLVDGIRMSDVQTSHYALDLAVPLAAIERIELLHGSGSALYGSDAVGGVINIVTRRGATPLTAQLRGGSFGTVGGNAAAGTQVGSLSLLGSAEYEQSDGYRLGTDYRIGQGRLSMSAPAGSGRVEGNLAFGLRDFGANAFYAPYNSVEETGTLTADARWRTAAGGWAFTTTAGTRRHTDLFTLIKENPAVYQNQHTNWQHSAEVVARRQVGGAALALGGELFRATLASARLGDRAETRSAGFGELAFGGDGAARLSLGVRGDHSSTFGSFLSPSVATSLTLTRAATLHASVDRGLRAPSWTDRYYVDPGNQGTADLAPERFWSGEVGLRLVGDGALALDVTAFLRDAENLIDWVKSRNAGPTEKWVATNLGDAEYRGLEARLTLPVSPRWQGLVTASTLTFEGTSGAGLVGKYALRPITRRITAQATYTPVTALRASVEVVGSRRATEDGYLTGNVRLEWRPGPLGVLLDVTNLADAEWLDASGQIVAGRAVYLGVSWQGRRR